MTRGCSSVGRAPALQAGGQEFESLHLHSSGKPDEYLHLENRILKKDLIKDYQKVYTLIESTSKIPETKREKHLHLYNAI